MAHGFAKANQFAASASQSAIVITTTISRSNNPPGAGSIPAPPPNTTKMKASDKQLYNALAYLVLFGKQLKNTLEELTFAIEKSESLLIAHNLKSTRSKK